MATKPPELINRSAINVDRATNRSALATLGAGIAAAIAGVNTHQPIWEWLPIVAMAVMSAFSQYLQGGPSKNMQMVQRILDIEGGTNADIIRGGITRLAGDRGGDRVGRDDLVFRQSERGLDAPDVSDHPHRPTVNLGNVSVPEWSHDAPRPPIDPTVKAWLEQTQAGLAAESEDGPRSEAW
jgi:hypothetical protein